MKVKSQVKKRVFVGISGGVDSAVSAALLKQQGYEVVGVFIKAWTPPGYPCTWREDRRSAMRVCAVLDIPFFTLDLEKEYKEGVVDYMVEEYRAGRTPNPDVMCNKEIKFGAFLDWALAKKADYIATGHYARVFASPYQGEAEAIARVRLLESKDKNKDQSYFLWTLTQDQLKHTLFPVGGLEKPEVRKLAKKFKLPQATRKDSQGLCFLGQVDMKEFLSRYINPKKGDVLNQKGEKIGFHNGALFYTLGERHGFTVENKTDQDRPLYVVAKDIKKNTITVAPKVTNAKVLRSRRSNGVGHFDLQLSSLNIISTLPKKGIQCRFRYRQEKMKCKIKNGKGKTWVELENLEERPASGQSVVFYDKEVCLGGGVIV